MSFYLRPFWFQSEIVCRMIKPNWEAGLGGTVDVEGVIDSQKLSLYQCIIGLMAWITLFLDGVDTQSLAYVGPAIGMDWGLGRGALGPVFSAGIIGVAFGAIFVGPLADRFGRKRVIVSTVSYVAVFSFLVTLGARYFCGDPGRVETGRAYGAAFSGRSWPGRARSAWRGDCE